MPRITYRRRLVRALILNALRDLFPANNFEEDPEELQRDLSLILLVLHTRYLHPRLPVPKSGSLQLAFHYAEIPHKRNRFTQMLRVTPEAFHHLLHLIQNHPIFVSKSSQAQTPVEYQLAVTLYRAGRYGNGVSVEDVARIAGISEGSVLSFTKRCMTAILCLESQAMRKPTPEEKEMEKEWIEGQVGCPSFRDGWCTGDGTLVRLYQKPGLNGDAYFSRKMHYDLNVQVSSGASCASSTCILTPVRIQIINMFKSLRIVDFVVGFTGSAHDSAAFQYSSIIQNPRWLLEPGEFMYADSAYTNSSDVIAVHKRPAADDPLNKQFDTAVAHIRIRSEHCMGALKGRWQSLRGLRIVVNRKRDHEFACDWIRMCLVLHNLVIDIEGEEWAQYYYGLVRDAEHLGRRGEAGGADAPAGADSDQKRRQLVMDLAAYKDEVRRLRDL